MTKREQEIIDILKREPMISQKDLADRLGISRSSVAVHITNLMKKEIIAGKGYFLRDERYVAVLGGANMDLVGSPFKSFRTGDSLPGRVVENFGGVGRNIAQNLALLGTAVRFCSQVGMDHYGDRLLEVTAQSGVDVSPVERVREYPTGMYLAIEDHTGDMIAAINQMAIYDHMDLGYVNHIRPVLESAHRIVLDTNLSESVLAYVLEHYGHKPILVDPVSADKAEKLKGLEGYIHTLKPNRAEAERLSGIPIKDEDGLKANLAWFLNQGIKNIIISLGSEGTWAADAKKQGRVVAKAPKVVGATGAGDAFLAAVACAGLETEDIARLTILGTAAAYVTMADHRTINPELTRESLDQIEKEYEIVWQEI